MTCLPLIGRELRARARQRAFYRLRFGVGIVGALICLPQMLTPWGWSLASMGQAVFKGLTGATFFLCGCACLWTADVISSEKREGTLGLLFLTHVKEVDLLLGKFGSAGLTGLCALAACTPMMVIPLLAGGVTGGEAFRRGLVLLNTLFLSLAIGLYQSSANRARSDAIWRSMAAVGALVLLPCLAVKLPGFSLSGVGYLSPLCGLLSAGDYAYQTAPERYWIGLGLTHGLAWMLVSGAAFHLRRSVRQTADGGEAALLEETASGIIPRGRQVPLETEMNPVEWLVLRQRGIRKVFWMAAAVSVAYHLFWLLSSAGVLNRGPQGYWIMQWPSLAVSGTTCGLLAWGASQFVIRARGNGELELLLTTSLGPESLIQGQWRALKGLLTAPVIAMILMWWTNILFPAGVRNTLSVAQLGPGGFFYGSAWIWTLDHLLPAIVGSVLVLLSVSCICWLALDAGLRSRNQSSVILRTLGFGMVLPRVIDLASRGYFQVLLTTLVFHRGFLAPFPRTGWGSRLTYLVPQIIVMAYYLWMIGRARRRLARTLRVRDAGSFSLVGTVQR